MPIETILFSGGGGVGGAGFSQMTTKMAVKPIIYGKTPLIFYLQNQKADDLGPLNLLYMVIYYYS